MSEDLIREADEALDSITPGEWEVGIHRGDDRDWCFVAPTGGMDGSTLSFVDRVADECTEDDARFIAAAPDLVRRLRDALEASEAIRKRRGRALVAAARERDALVEAIERVKALAERMERSSGDGGVLSTADLIRRAIEGEQA